MTQEEKAKAYDEALERARSMYESRDDAELAAFIFPELAESEDERVSRWIYTCIKNLGYPADEQAEIELDEMQPLALAWLEKQKEHKPAEWSEEDELMRSACIAFIQDEKFKGYERAYECIDWLKSLRPSWKPSEEQMAALLNIEGDLRAFQHDDKAKIIAELYEQLKRLL